MLASGIASTEPPIEPLVLFENKLRGAIEVIRWPRQQVIDAGFGQFASSDTQVTGALVMESIVCSTNSRPSRRQPTLD